MKSVMCLVFLWVVSATIADNAGKPECPCSPEDKQEDYNSRLRIAWLVLLNYKTKLHINQLEKQLGRNETAFSYDELAEEDISVLTDPNMPECACGRNVDREKKNTYQRSAYLALYSYEAQLQIIQSQKEMGLPVTSFELEKFVWPDRVLATGAPSRERRQASCPNGCILFCNRYGGVRYNKDGSCTNGIQCQCIRKSGIFN